VKKWLYDLFLPFVHEAYRIVRAQHHLPPLPNAPTPMLNGANGADNTGETPYMSDWVPPTPAASPTPPGYLSLFNQHLQQNRKAVEWVFESERGEGTKTTPVWRAKAKHEGGYLAVGRGNTKKAAQNDAAKEGLIKLGVTVNANDTLPHA